MTSVIGGISKGVLSFLGSGNNNEGLLGILDEGRLSEEEELKANIQYNLENKKMDIQQDLNVLKDKQSAREHQSRIQESKHSSWLAKNVQSILALTFVGITLYLIYEIFINSENITNEKRELLIQVLDFFKMTVILILGYYFGSSRGSDNKNRIIENSQKLQIPERPFLKPEKKQKLFYEEDDRYGH